MNTDFPWGYSVSTDKNRLDIDRIHGFLSQTYWAKGISREIVEQSIKGSFCFGVFFGEEQIGFARAITDHATFAYLADVYIEDSHQGKGLGKLLVKYITSHPKLEGLRLWMLRTKDAHGLYELYGFKSTKEPEKIMERRG